MLKSKFLQWDSGFFGIQIVRVDLYVVHIEELISCLTNHFNDGIELIYLFSPNKLDNFNWESTNISVKSVGGKVLFLKEISEQLSFDTKIESYESNIVSDELLSLTIQSGIYSRFKLDKELPLNSYEKLYTKWIENSVKKEIADEVLVYRDENKILGMISLSKKNIKGDIGLIAVDELSRGKRIGQKLLNASNRYFFDKGITLIGVETQTQNINACEFYKVNNYVESTTEYIYHCRIKV